VDRDADLTMLHAFYALNTALALLGACAKGDLAADRMTLTLDIVRKHVLSIDSTLSRSWFCF